MLDPRPNLGLGPLDGDYQVLDRSVTHRLDLAALYGHLRNNLQHTLCARQLIRYRAGGHLPRWLKAEVHQGQPTSRGVQRQVLVGDPLCRTARRLRTRLGQHCPGDHPDGPLAGTEDPGRRGRGSGNGASPARTRLPTRPGVPVRPADASLEPDSADGGAAHPWRGVEGARTSQ